MPLLRREFGLRIAAVESCLGKEIVFMKSRIAPILFIGVSLCLIGCATKSATPSGQPEVTVRADPADVGQAFCHSLADRGFTIDRSEGTSIVASKDGSVAHSVLLGTAAHPVVRDEIHLNLIQDGGAVRVVYHAFSGGQEIFGGRDRAQAWLESVAARLGQH